MRLQRPIRTPPIMNHDQDQNQWIQYLSFMKADVPVQPTMPPPHHLSPPLALHALGTTAVPGSSSRSFVGHTHTTQTDVRHLPCPPPCLACPHTRPARWPREPSTTPPRHRPCTSASRTRPSCSCFWSSRSFSSPLTRRRQSS